LHPPPLIPVVLKVLPVVLQTLRPSGQSPDRSGGPARPDALDTPHVESRKEEQKEARGEQVRANVVIVMPGVFLDGRHGADQAQKTARHPRDRAGAAPGGALFRSTRRGLALLWQGLGCHDYTIVICNGWGSKAPIVLDKAAPGPGGLV
jgi:hypothetical protein